MKSSVLPVVIAVLFHAATASAQIPSMASADLVIGQGDFNSSAIMFPPDSGSLFGPRGVAVDPTTGKLFVADTNNSRILRFDSVDALSNGAGAEAVLGQVNFVSQTPNPGGVESNTLSAPSGLAFDGAGRLWVADRGNDRVLMFENASSIGTGAPANRVFGQPGTATSGPATTAVGMDSPEGVWIDGSGNLWVGDTGNNRVLRFANAAGLANGAAAIQVIGQSNFTSGGVVAPSASSMEQPFGVSVDGSGTLWVADRLRNRVLGFPNAAGLGNGPAASRVVGQPNFTLDTVAPTSAGSLFSPTHAVVDAFGALWICDSGNNRVLRYEDASSISIQPNASGVLGQATFANGSSGTAANRFDPGSGAGIFLETSGDLWVADGDNNRVLRFTRPPDPVIADDTTRPVIKVRGRKSIETLRKRVVFRGTASDASGVREILVKARKKDVKVRKVKLLSRDRWKVVLRVTKDRGRVVVKFRAVDEVGNRSGVQRVRILRR